MKAGRVIYHETQDQFYTDILTNRYIDKMVAGAESYNIKPGLSEKTSWMNNGPKIRDLLMLSEVKDTYVTFEFNVPYNMKRIDCMVYGKDINGKGNVVHIELKQWANDSVKPSKSAGNFDVEDDNYEVVAFTGGRNRIVSHPSQQVKGYNDYLINFIEVFSKEDIGLQGLAYCYNYRKNSIPNALYDDRYETLLKEHKTYSGDEVTDLAKDIYKALGGGDGLKIFNRVMHSPIRPSRKLLDSAANMVHEGNANAFSLLADQIVAKNIIFDKIRKLNERKKKSVILVKGGPGTGKTVIALHILAMLASKGKYDIHYATKSKSLLEGVKYNLPRGSKAKKLFSNITQFVPSKFEDNQLDVLLVDEAHRITKSANTQFTKAKDRTDMPQVDTLVKCAKVAVFFIDDKQGIRYQEIGSSHMIKECALKFDADIEEVELKTQFRCNGSNNYLDWLEQILYNEKVTASFTPDEFDFKIFDSPQKLYDAILEVDRTEGKTARLCAGFCWPWSKRPDENGQLVKDVRIGDFAMPWETHGEITTPPPGYVKWFEWAYKPEGIKQVGCIYTAQGFEFDYVGVIVGRDLKYSVINNCLITDITETEDPTLNRSRAKFDEYVRNIYRVLMSRGMKGCYVYFCDKNVEEYFRKHLKQSIS